MPRRLRNAPDHRGELRLERANELGCDRLVARREAELPHLFVRLRDVVGRRLQQHGDAELVQLRDEPTVVRHDDEIGVVARYRLDVRREAGEARPRRLLRVVGVVVDRDHLRAGTDREEILGGSRRERDDARRAGLDDDVAVGGVDRHGECCGP